MALLGEIRQHSRPTRAPASGLVTAFPVLFTAGMCLVRHILDGAQVLALVCQTSRIWPDSNDKKQPVRRDNGDPLSDTERGQQISDDLLLRAERR